MTWERELEVAARAARAASASVLELYGAVEVEMKGTDDPVTEADRRANAQIVRTLRHAFPDDGIVAEESRDDPSVRTRGGRVWFVDPLDGTKEFIAKNGEFSVMIGLAVDGFSRVGVVHRPVGDVLFAGSPDGAWREAGETVPAGHGDATTRKRCSIRVSARSRMEEVRLVVSRSHRESIIDAMRADLGIGSEAISGSVGLKVGLLVDDLADLYVHPSRHARLWDACAPEAILVAAGGRMTDCRGRPIRYDASETRCEHGLVASNGLVHDAVVEWMARSVASTDR